METHICYIKRRHHLVRVQHPRSTDGHPRNETTNSVYYIKYKKGIFYRADGTQIGDLTNLPIAHSKSDIIYNGRETHIRAWVWDIALEAKGNPVVVYTTHPKETEHHYHYAVHTDAGWQNHHVSPGGGWFPQTQEGKTEREPHYSGGVSINHTDPSVVYLSRPVNGVFEIERWQTSDAGQTWSSKAITQNSTDLNVRPVIPRRCPPSTDLVLWMYGTYIHYTNYQTQILISK